MALLTNKFDTFGLDIGDNSIKIAYIKSHGSDFELKSYGKIDVPEKVFDRGNITNPKELEKTIKTLFSSVAPKKIKTRYAHACLPEMHTFIKMIKVRKMPYPEITAHIRETISQHMPIEPEESYIDWRPIDEDIKEKDNINILVGAVPKKTADSYTEILINSGLIPVSLQIEAEAIVRAMLPIDMQIKTKTTAIIDIGAARSSFIAVNKGSIIFSVSMPTSGNAITQAIAQKLSIPEKEAEQAKKIHSHAPGIYKDAIQEILDEKISMLIENIKKNILFYSERFPNEEPISNIALSGGGANLFGLNVRLNKGINNMNIFFGSPLINLQKRRKRLLEENDSPSFIFAENTEHALVPEQFKDESILSYSTAIGLGLSNVL